MGQRSQMYVRLNDANGKKILIAARYFQWNFGASMVSRARNVLEWLENNMLSYPEFFLNPKDPMGDRLQLKTIMEVNFDCKSVVLSRDIIEEYKRYAKEFTALEFTDMSFSGQDNNDGQFFLDCIIDYNGRQSSEKFPCMFKYAFLDPGNYDRVMDAIQYMDKGYKGWRTTEHAKDEVEYTKRNAKYISKNAKLMTPEEVDEFINYDYLKSMRIEPDNIPF